MAGKSCAKTRNNRLRKRESFRVCCVRNRMTGIDEELVVISHPRAVETFPIPMSTSDRAPEDCLTGRGQRMYFPHFFQFTNALPHRIQLAHAPDQHSSAPVQ